MNFLKSTFTLIKKTAVNFSRDNASMLAASLAYYTIFAIAPLLVIAVAVAGFIFGDAAVEGQVVEAIQGTVGRETAVLIENLITSASDSGAGIIATIISTTFLIFAASGLFSQLQKALNIIWDVSPPQNLGVFGFLKKRAVAFGMVLMIGLVLLISITTSTVLTALSGYLAQQLPVVGPLLARFELLVSFLILIVLFALIFKVLPDAIVGWRDVFVGGLVTAVLFSVGKVLIGTYLSYSGDNATYQAAGSIVILLLWIYYSSQILLLGAEFTQTYANSHGNEVRSVAAEVTINLDSASVQKVTAFITRKRLFGTQLLVFQHPTAGIQLPAGTVEMGEDLETAVLREAFEETGLSQLNLKKYLGCWENELADGEVVTTQPVRLLSAPAPDALPFAHQFGRGVSLATTGRVENGFLEILYREFDQLPEPTEIRLEIQGWVMETAVSQQKKRHYYWLTCDQETPDRWTQQTDGHEFTLFWTPLTPKPTLVSPQDRWLEDVYLQLVD